jgi:23S rRNA (uracil1939-C5)-methyltransferase
VDNKPAAPAPEVAIEKWVYGGTGLGRVEGQVALVPFVLPGECVRLEVTKRKPDLLEGHAAEWLVRSEARVEPPCPWFTRCGGCHYQHAPYEFQLERKKEILAEVLRRVGKIEAPGEIAVAAAEPLGYRNRTQFHLKGQAIGFRAAGSHELVPVEHCPISSPAINQALAALRGLVKNRRWPNFVEQIELFSSGEQTMVNVLATSGQRHVARQFFTWLAEVIPGADSGAIEMRAAGETFRVSHGSFFQVNRFLVDRLVELALEGAEGESALDLYAGVGLFSLPLARRFARVAAVESTSSATTDLRQNASAAALTVDAHVGQVGQYLQGTNTPPDFVVADPPRSGLGKPVVQELARLKPRRLNVVSCDPATLARDLSALISAGFRLDGLTLIDLFPQTFHIEAVARLSAA